MPKYIHIGYPKTGTTTLQNCFYNKVPSIEYVGVGGGSSNELGPLARDISRLCYYEIFGIEKLNNLAKDGTSNTDMHLFTDNEYLVSEERVRRIIQKVFINNNEALTLGSCEKFFDISRVANIPIDYYLNKLYTLLGRCKIFLTIREQKSFLEALYFENRKHRYTYKLPPMTFNRWYEQIKQEGYLEYINYYRVYERLSQIFGSQNIAIFIFEEFKDNHVKFLEKLCDYLQIDSSIVDSIELKRYNARLNRFGMKYVTIMRKLKLQRMASLLPSKIRRPLRDIYIDIMKQLFYKKRECIEYSEDIGQELDAIYRDDNRLLMKECVPHLSNYWSAV